MPKRKARPDLRRNVRSQRRTYRLPEGAGEGAMIALSILQPYAWLIVTGRKDIENRTWRTGRRGRVLIHAGKNYPKRDYADDADQFDGYPLREQMIGGV